MASWYQTVRGKTDFILEEIKDHPFITELIKGTLPKDVFQYYINQDSLYLSEYKKILALLSVKCTNTEDALFFLNSATGIINVENELHLTFIDKSNFNKEASPSCELYTSYLARIVNNHSIEEGLAAVLPCFTIYKEIGDYVLAHQSNKKDNPYQDWINTYGGEDFENSVNKAVEITNRHAQTASDEKLKNMELAFAKASKLEWMFWDSAYNKEKWKI
ncbi:MAG: thiaminase II [Nonlabens sp.]|jgi:thiaminase/transcriptional activator TenA|uniref:thiaminase II n=1 Tax=Nonlabens sp. TaxID=1888209 RepID=UPI0035A5EE56